MLSGFPPRICAGPEGSRPTFLDGRGRFFYNVHLLNASVPHRAFIQARLSSTRFPGKVLAPFRGRTVLGHVVERCAAAVGLERVVVATSTDPTDDAVAAHARERGAAVFRGPLEDVFGRLRACLLAHPADWFFRVSADSPLVDPAIMKAMLPLAVPGLDLVTNVFPRSFPKGQSAELLRAAAFLAVDPAVLTASQREHVTTAFYDHPERYRILNVESGRPDWPGAPLVVDTREDLARLEAAYPAGRPLPSWAPAARSAA